MKTYEPTPAVKAQVETTFRPTEVKATVNSDQIARMDALTSMAKLLAVDIIRLSPPSREQSLALTKLDEALMMANAAIARHE